MTQYLVELYSPNARWTEQSSDQRKAFVDGIKNGMAGLATLGIEALALGEIDRTVDHSGKHRFLGIWRFPNLAARDALLAGILASGWYDYFDHINAASSGGNLEPHLTDLMS
ncbi:hypothetical protein ABID97_005433 [Variovorax sp. OAS795]|uniref:DUF6616 family protein n=1 Tax=Variovorax sp. OAS795 TaxID=3034231 RepID=UPI0033912A81